MNTAQRTTSKIMRAAFAAALFLTVIGLQGCTPDSAVFGDGTQEVVSPTGCLKSQGRYYDPVVKQCVQVDNREQAFILDAYRYVNKLAEEGTLNEADYDIDFKTYIDIDTAETLWTELREQGGTMLVFGGVLPSNRQYDVLPGRGHPILEEEQYQNPPLAWGIGPVSLGCGWHNDFDKPADTLLEMLEKGIETIEADSFVEPARPHPELRKVILEEKGCRIDTIVVTVKPSVMRDFWNNHLDIVKAIQPEVNFVDKAQASRNFGPTLPVEAKE